MGETEAWVRTEAQALNPWISMWTKPRATIRQIVAADPRRLVLALAAVAGISEGFDIASNAREFLDVTILPAVLSFAAVSGAILGICGLYICAAVVRWTGIWIGGQASSLHIRAAIAWSRLPVVWIAPLWLPMTALYGQELFTDKAPALDATVGGQPAMALSLLCFYLAGFVAELWSFFLLLKSLGEVQGFSAWKALGNLILASLLICLAVFVLVIVSIIVIGALINFDYDTWL